MLMQYPSELRYNAISPYREIAQCEKKLFFV